MLKDASTICEVKAQDSQTSNHKSPWRFTDRRCMGERLYKWPILCIEWYDRSAPSSRHAPSTSLGGLGFVHTSSIAHASFLIEPDSLHLTLLLTKKLLATGVDLFRFSWIVLRFDPSESQGSDRSLGSHVRTPSHLSLRAGGRSVKLSERGSWHDEDGERAVDRSMSWQSALSWFVHLHGHIWCTHERQLLTTLALIAAAVRHRSQELRRRMSGSMGDKIRHGILHVTIMSASSLKNTGASEPNQQRTTRERASGEHTAVTRPFDSPCTPEATGVSCSMS